MDISPAKTVTVTQAVTFVADTLVINNRVDDGQSVYVNVTLSLSSSPSNFIKKRVILWNDKTNPTYTAVGDWTENQAQAQTKIVLGVN
jgi:hypothetical protein